MGLTELGWHADFDNGEGAGEYHLIIDFNENGIIAGFLKFQAVNVIDQINSVLGARRFEFAVNNGSGFLLGHR